MTAKDVASYSFNSSMPVQIRYNDIDPAGHVNNGVFHDFFDLGRIHYFNEVIGGLTQEQHIIVAQSNTTYVEEVFFDDDLQVVSKIINQGTKSFKLLQAILRNSDEGYSICTYNITTFVCINFVTRETHPIPEEWRKKFTEFEGQCGR